MNILTTRKSELTSQNAVVIGQPHIGALKAVAYPVSST